MNCIHSLIHRPIPSFPNLLKTCNYMSYPQEEGPMARAPLHRVTLGSTPSTYYVNDVRQRGWSGVTASQPSILRIFVLVGF